MREIEVKILDIDVSETIVRILESGGEKTFDGQVKVIFYDFPNQCLRNKEKRLRVRSFGDRVELTYKKKIGKERVKIAEELEVNVSNFGEMKRILEAIGMVEGHKYSKHRISFRVKNVCFEIDSIPGCPPLLEIEAVDEQTVYKWVEWLGFDKTEAKPWSGTDVIEYYS